MRHTNRNEDYTSKFSGLVKKDSKFPASFELATTSSMDPYFVFFQGFRFESVGCDNIEDYMDRPTARESLEIIDELREATRSYFPLRQNPR